CILENFESYANGGYMSRQEQFLDALYAGVPPAEVGQLLDDSLVLDDPDKREVMQQVLARYVPDIPLTPADTEVPACTDGRPAKSVTMTNTLLDNVVVVTFGNQLNS